MLRIGYINIDGYCISSLEEMNKYGKVYKPQIAENVIEKGRTVLDVRKPGQWQKGVVAGETVKFELGNLFKNVYLF